MKRFYAVAIMFITLFSCVFLSACGDKYKNLKMDFVDLDGDALYEVRLVIDDNAAEEERIDQIRLGVKFSNIDAGDIGSVSIASNPSELVDVSEKSFTNDTYYFTISARNPGIGKLEIIHNSSNKKSSINLVVDKKASDLRYNTHLKPENFNGDMPQYIATIPDGENTKNLNINLQSIFDLFGGTDIIKFGFLNNQSIFNISEPFYVEDLVISSSIEDGSSVVLYPITTMDGYELTNEDYYRNFPLEILFKKQISEEEIVLTTDENHQSYLEANSATNPIILVSKDGDRNYRSLQFNLNMQQGEELINLLRGTDFNDFYAPKFEAESVVADSGDKQSVNILPITSGEFDLEVSVSGRTTNVVVAHIAYAPINSLGELENFEKVIYIKGENAPTKIDVFDTSNGEIYDYYVDANGALFKFNPLESNSFEDLRLMRMFVDVDILNYSSKEIIYTDATFNVLDVAYENRTPNNKYLLDIFKGNNLLKFYYDATRGKFVSQVFRDSDDIYVKYQQNLDATATGTNDLYFDVSCDYLANDATADYTNLKYGKLDYLQGIKTADDVRISFANRMAGAKSVTLYGGYLTNSGDGVNCFSKDGQYIDANDVYLNRLEGLDNADVEFNGSKIGAYVLYIPSAGVVGDDNKLLGDTQFNLTLIGGGQNPLKLLQYQTGYGNGRNSELLNAEIATKFVYNNFGENAAQSRQNSLLFVFDASVDIGTYQLVLSQNNGFEKIVNCNIYQQMYLTDFNVVANNLDTTKKLSFENSQTNETNKTYIFEDYQVDYIVAKGQELNFSININNAQQFENVFDTTRFDCTIDFVEDYQNYVEKSIFINNVVNLNFVGATYIERPEYLTVNFIVRVKKFDNILTINGTTDLTISKTFYVFDLIKNSGQDKDVFVKINNQDASSVKLFPNGMVGIYYQKYSSADFKLEIANTDLLNYALSLEKENGFAYTHSNKVMWQIDGSALAQIACQRNNDYLTLTLLGNIISKDRIEIRATIKQFNITHTFNFVIIAEEPVLSDSVNIVSGVDFKEASQERYINIKTGEQTKINAVTYTKLTDGSKSINDNNDVVLLIIDNSSRVCFKELNTNIIETDQIRYSANANLRLVVFAKDGVNQLLPDLGDILNSPSNYLISTHSQAYVTIDLILSDGSERNPYLIRNAKDFWNVQTNNANVNYKLMSNVYVNTNEKRLIDNFTGTIFTDSYKEGETDIPYLYSIYGIELNNKFKNVFTNFNGKIKNVNFEVSYNYNLSVADTTYLGIIDKAGTASVLTNVTLIISNTATINNAPTAAPLVIFGGLVGANFGKIEFNSNTIVGVDGSINLFGNAQTYFGALVGVNYGQIIGYDALNAIAINANYAIRQIDLPSTVAAEILFNNSGAISNANIYSQLSNVDTAIGGLVGLNANQDLFSSDYYEPTIINAYVSGSITGKNNVGGIVGKNKQTSANVSVTMQLTSGQTDQIQNVVVDKDNFYFKNLKSSVVIIGEDNVGGLVGFDEGGSFYNCHYQILSGDQTNGIFGKTAVGGLVGYSKYGVFNFCSVMSYCWDYANLDDLNFSSTTDIVGENFVGGIVGKAQSDLPSVSGGSFNNSVAITYSSVNALIAVRSSQNIGGILSADASGISIIFNASFIGKLGLFNNGAIQDYSMPDNESLSLSNRNTSFYNYVYQVLAKSTGITDTTYARTNGSTFTPTNTNMANWAHNQEINGGYIYLTIDGRNPIFEISPSGISINVKNGHEIKDSDGQVIQKLINLKYYQFSSSIPENAKKYFNEQFNKIKLSDIISYDIIPSGFDANNIRVIVETTNSSVAEISNNYLILKGLGECEILFYSALNTNIRDSITIITTAPIGEIDIINGGDDATTSVGDTEQQIAVGYSNNYSILINAFETYNDIQYEITNAKDQQVYMDISISATNGGNIAEYLSIPNEDNKTLQGLGTANLSISTNTLTIQVLKYYEGTFNFTINLYSIISYKDKLIKLPFNKNISFSLKTYRGPESISASCSDVYLYPNAETTIFAFVKTDIEIAEADLEKKLWLNDELFTGSAISLNFLTRSYDASTQILTFSYRLTIGTEFLDADDIKNLRVYFKLMNNVDDASVEFEIYPQMIDDIETKNYIYETDENGDLYAEESNTLRPIGEMGGLITINVVPENGYYDYFEIKDITGNEEIVFAQLTAPRTEGGTRLSEFDTATQDGKGIKLKKPTTNTSHLYVETKTSVDYSSKLHTVLISAFDNHGNLLKQVQMEIDVVMLPSISIDYVDPNGVVYNTENPMSDGAIYLAAGVEAHFKVNVRNSNGEPEFEYLLAKNGSVLNFEEYFNGIINQNDEYLLLPKPLDNVNNLLGATLKITAKTTSSLNTGKLEVATDEIEFNLVEYVIHNFSLQNSQVDYAANARVLYGNFGVETPIKFYFAKTDISYVSGGDYWNTEYFEDSDQENIANLLKELNGSNYKQYLSLGKVVNGQFIEAAAQLEQDNIALLRYDNGIILQVNSNSEHNLALKFNVALLYKNSNWQIDGTNSPNAIKYNYVYMLDFVDVSSILHPSVITTIDEFMDMRNRGVDNYYILGNDLILQNYQPFELNVGSLDGNGRKIIIQSFAPFQESEIMAGLFTRISQHTAVSNLDVIYDTSSGKLGAFTQNLTNQLKVASYLDLCSPNVEYSAAYFGGLAVQNDGIITNCKIYGAVALTASTIENQTNATEIINFNIGGMVCHNSSYGYITNSDCYLAIYSYANIGGFAYSNNGKIASSAYDASAEFKFDNIIKYHTAEDTSIRTITTNSTGAIFANNPTITKSIKIEAAGFVVYNGGATDILTTSSDTQFDAVQTVEISMCYTSFGETNQSGNISMKNDGAGFVYSNSSTISDCYVNIKKLGVIGGMFAGFVCNNTNAESGKISRCYTFINNGVSDNKFYSMFAPKETQGIEDSIEILSSTDNSLDYRVNGVRQLLTMNMTIRSSYPELMFGNNINGVWQMPKNGLPVLTATQNKVKYVVNELTNENFYFGLRQIKREYIEGDNGSLDVEDDTLLDNGYGTIDNPAIVYNIELWNYYLGNNSSYAVRLVRDINFDNEHENPKTSQFTFGGNLQGNNMSVLNYRVSSEDSLEAVGLFKKLSQPSTATLASSVSNLILKPKAIRASRTQAVGALAGILEGFTAYNIRVDNENLMVIGGNAVGGLVGIARGAFDIDGIYCNVGVDSETMSNSNYDIYQSVNNGCARSQNIKDVYYAGAVIGILDGFNNSSYNLNAQRDYTNSNYQEVRNIQISNHATVMGNIVGSVFGFVGEKVRVKGLNVNLTSGYLFGSHYTGGLVGENRGVLLDCSFTTSDNVFNYSSSASLNSYVSAGLVGLNLGGIVVNGNVTTDIVKSTRQTTHTIVGGVVGRNVNGYIENCNFSGNLMGYFTGGIVGAVYDAYIFKNSSEVGALAEKSRTDNVIPSADLKYSRNGVVVDNFIENSTISGNTLNFWFENISSFYSFVAERENFLSSFNYGAVLGLAIGSLQVRETINQPTNDVRYITRFGYNEDTNTLVFNGDYDIDTVGMIVDADLGENVTYTTPYLNIINKLSVDKTYIMFVTGIKTSSFDKWERNGYSNELVAFTNQNVVNLTIQKYLLHLEGELKPDEEIPEQEEKPKYEEDTFELTEESVKFYLILQDDFTFDIYCAKLAETSNVYYALVIDFSPYMEDESSITVSMRTPTNMFAIYDYVQAEGSQTITQYMAGYDYTEEGEGDERVIKKGDRKRVDSLIFKIMQEEKVVRSMAFNLK